jgi:hypothetical protein
MARKIEIKVGDAVLFEMSIDNLETGEKELIADNLKLAQEMIDSGKPARAAVYIGTALFIPNIIQLMDGIKEDNGS